ncbi:hypothetical protein ABT214_09435 [Micromonospora purpureochromogenes]|uniref:hypothetical protein n=1 Tax=Micromonospora purpureochromogenes TaxID=47872 RepID=UPI003331BED6
MEGRTTAPARLGAVPLISERKAVGVQPLVNEPIDAVEKVLGELPMPPYVTGEHVRLAVRAVVVHSPESWPAGPMCRSDRTPYPCRLHRWGGGCCTRGACPSGRSTSWRLRVPEGRR